MPLPPVSSVPQLEDILSEPYPEDREAMRGPQGDVLVLGAGGKMGPTLVRRLLLARQDASRRVFAVSRFSDAAVSAKLEGWGATTIQCDLLDRKQLEGLPTCPMVIHMAGMKFGTSGNEPATWTVNAHLAGLVAERFKSSRIVAFSTGNVYPLVPVASGGSKETDPPAPVGEYAQSCLGRERILQRFSEVHSTPMTILRLNYAIEARYGVLLDIAQRLCQRRPVPLGMGHFNAIWQGDANSVALRSFRLCRTPPLILNVTGPEILSVREVARRLASRLGVDPLFEGVERDTALLSGAGQCIELFGVPRVSIDSMIDLVAGWVDAGGATLDKPTRFEVRNGAF